MEKWMAKLTKAQLAHCLEGGMTTPAAVKRTITWQREHPGINGQPCCRECEAIAKRLKL